MYTNRVRRNVLYETCFPYMTKTSELKFLVQKFRDKFYLIIRQFVGKSMMVLPDGYC